MHSTPEVLNLWVATQKWVENLWWISNVLVVSSNPTLSCADANAIPVLDLNWWRTQEERRRRRRK